MIESIASKLGRFNIITSKIDHVSITRKDLVQPTIHLTSRSKNSYQLAIAAHLVAPLGSLIVILNSFISLGDDPIWATILITLAILVIVIEFDIYSFPELKNAEIRAIVWIVIGILAFQITLLGGIIQLIAGVLYLLYYNGF